MSLLFAKRSWGGSIGQPAVPPGRPVASVGTIPVTPDSALKMSSVWAACRLRADMVSTVPLSAWRNTGTQNVPVGLPPALTGFDNGVTLSEWLYSSQMDLDRYGNAYAIKEFTGKNGESTYPQQLIPVPASGVSVNSSAAGLIYKIGNKVYDPAEIWHERAYTVNGSVMGLSPVSYAAMAVGRYLAADSFSASWFGGGQVPKGHLKNTNRPLSASEAMKAATRFSDIHQSGGVFVSGSDWEYSPLQATDNDTAFLDAMEASATDIARYFGVPADMIDAPSGTGSSITYANIAQRNLQFLIMHLQPAMTRREVKFSNDLMPKPQFVQFDPAALLMRMDPMTEATVIGQQIKDRWLAPDEARATKNRLPFTENNYDQFDRLFAKISVPETAQDIVDGSAQDAPAGGKP